MKISAYASAGALSADDITVVLRGPQPHKLTAAVLASYLLNRTTPGSLLVSGSDRLLMESGELLQRDGSFVDALVQDFEELTAPSFDDILVAASAATHSVRLADLAAYIAIVTTAAPHLLTEAGDTLTTEDGSQIEVE